MAGLFLRFVQQCHQIMGVYPCQPNQKQYPTHTIQQIFLFCMAQFIFATAVFLVFDAKSLFEYGFTFFLLTAVTNSIVIYLIFIWQLQNTLTFIENCEEFIEKRVHSAAAYKEVIEKIEQLNKYLCVAIYITVAVVLFSSILIYSFARYYIFDIGADSFYLFFLTWYPFNWKTPFGYLVVWFAQFAGIAALSSILGQFSNLLIGSCWLFIFIAEDITRDVAAFNNIAKTTSNKNHTELTKHFCDMVQIYWDAKQCITEFKQVMKYSLFSSFLWNMLAISSVLVTLQFQLWTADSNLFEIVFLCFILTWMFTFTFILCEPGAIMTNQFEVFSNELSGCDWFFMSMKLQRMYIILLSDTQNRIKMFSYASITCERETLKKIINTAFSYFMTMRRFRA